jgi:predicted metal-dependent hydrolase
MAILPGSPPVDVTLRRSAQARRFSLRVSRVDGRVTLTLPHRAREAEAMAFLVAQEGWLRRTLQAMPVVSGIGIGAVVPVEGVSLIVAQGTGRSVRIAEDRLLVPGEPGQMGARVAAYLKVRARDRLAGASDHYSGLLGRPYNSLSLRDTRSRWGSCTVDGRLMYSWRLIMAPPPVLDYVAAHEVAHLAEMNHSAAYWTIVSRLYPGWQVQRQWLRSEGQTLQAIRFGA